MSEEILFRAEGISAGYQGKKTIREFTFAARSGELLILMGPNGAGKSTVLKAVTGRIPLLAGKMYLQDQEMNMISAEERAKRIGAFFPERIRTEHVSCLEMVEMGRYPYTGHFGVLGKADHAAVEEAMALTNVSELAERDFMQLSDGQRQRVLLARAICQEPKLLVLDEPTAYLDIRYQLEFLSLLRKLCREREIAAVLSVHEVELAWRAADRLLCVKDGTMAAYGTPVEVLHEQTLQQLFDIDETRLKEEQNKQLAEYAGMLGKR